MLEGIPICIVCLVDAYLAAVIKTLWQHLNVRWTFFLDIVFYYLKLLQLSEFKYELVFLIIY